MLRTSVLITAIAAVSPIAQSDEKTAVVVGKPAPDFTATGIDGQKFKLSDKLKAGDTNIALMFSRANW